jgi:DivIVA domain-containing protein
MDVSPKTVREVEFREKLRGYHPEDVDQFLERVAKGIEILQERLRAATERAVRAERSAADSTENDDTLRRTLVLAQRTADAAVQEAREQAAQIVAEAEAHAKLIASDAEARAVALIEETEGGVRDEVAQLVAGREALLEDMSSITHWIEDHRTYLTDALSQAVERLRTDLQAQRVPPTPRVVDIPAAHQLAAEAQPASEQSSAPAHDVPEATSSAPSPPVDERPTGSNPVATSGEAVWGPQGRRSERQESAEAEQFFAELRRAVDDPEPLGPRDADLAKAPPAAVADLRESAFFDEDDTAAAGRGLGSRLRRRR